MELQSETGRIALVYSAKSVNIVAGGKGEVTISEDGSTLKANIVEQTCQKRASLQ